MRVGGAFRSEQERFGGAWRLRLGYYPEVGLRRFELVDRDRDEVVYSGVAPLEAEELLAAGDYLVGLRLPTPDPDGWLWNSNYPNQASLVVERVSLRVANSATRWQVPSERAAPLRAASALLCGGDRARAYAAWGRASRRSAAERARLTVFRMATWEDRKETKRLAKEVLAVLATQPLDFVQAFEESLRVASGKALQRAGIVLRTAQERDATGICRVLQGDPRLELLERAPPEVAAYLRLRRPRAHDASREKGLLTNVGIRGPGPHLPVAAFTVGDRAELESFEGLLAEVRAKGVAHLIKRPRETWSLVSRALTLKEDDPDALYLWGLLEVVSRRPGGASVPARRLSERHPKRPEGWYLRGLLACVRGEKELAIEFLERATRAGMPRDWLGSPLRKVFNSIRDDPRFKALGR